MPRCRSSNASSASLRVRPRRSEALPSRPAIGRPVSSACFLSRASPTPPERRLPIPEIAAPANAPLTPPIFLPAAAPAAVLAIEPEDC